MADRIANIWGERTPFGRGVARPDRVDSYDHLAARAPRDRMRALDESQVTQVREYQRDHADHAQPGKPKGDART